MQLLYMVFISTENVSYTGWGPYGTVLGEKVRLLAALDLGRRGGDGNGYQYELNFHVQFPLGPAKQWNFESPRDHRIKAQLFMKSKDRGCRSG